MDYPYLYGVPGVGPGPSILEEDRYEPEKRRRLGGPGIRAFLNIAEAWSFSEEERLRVLGFPARATYFNWVSKAKKNQNVLLPVDTLLRISAVLGIHKGLRILFAGPQEGLAWLRNRHDAPTFGGQPPMALVTSGSQDGLMLVRRYLDAFRGGTFAAPNAADKLPALTSEDIVIV